MSILQDARGGGSPVASVLMSMLSGGQASGMGSASTVSGGGGGAPGIGGLAGLLAQFEQAGLGHVAQSWVGTGPNQPVSAEQLQGVLGHDQVQAMSAQTGMAPPALLSQLAGVLPGLVDRMTPGGKLPSASEMEGQAVRV